MRVRLFALFVAVVAAAFANGRPHPETDCLAAPYTAWALVRGGSFDIGSFPEVDSVKGTHVLEVSGGRWLSARPPGVALTAAPLVAPLALTRDRPPSSLSMLQLGKAVGAVCVALSACLFFVICHRLAPGGAWPATVLFAFGTCLFSVAGQALWMHGPAVLWLCVALYLLTGERADVPAALVCAGIALGLAVLARPTTAFFAVASVAALALDRRFRAAGWVTLGGAVPAALLAYYHAHYFGDLFAGGYKHDNWSESPPLWVGLGGLLVAPSRGVLVYSPALVFAALGAAELLRRTDPPAAGEAPPVEPVRTLLRLWLLAAVATLVFHARWHDWRGGWCFGPRFLCEAMPVACLLFGVAYHDLRSRAARAVAVLLVAASVAVHFVGVHGHGAYVAWHQRHDRADQGRCLFEFHDTQIEAHAVSFAHEMQKKLR